MNGDAYSIDSRNSGMPNAHVSDNEHDTSTRYEDTTQVQRSTGSQIVRNPLASTPSQRDAS